MKKNFKYKRIFYSCNINFDEFKKVHPKITIKEFEKLTGQTINKKKDELSTNKDVEGIKKTGKSSKSVNKKKGGDLQK